MHFNKRRCSTKRPAFTLVEMVVTITVGSVIMLSAVTVVHKAMGLRSRYHSDLDQSRKLENFVASWRQQVHRARSFDLASPTQLTIETSQHTIEFAFAETELTYKKISQASQQISRESLQLASGISCEFSAINKYTLQLHVSKSVPGRPRKTRLVTSAIASCRYFEERDSANKGSEVSDEE